VSIEKLSAENGMEWQAKSGKIYYVGMNLVENIASWPKNK